MSQDTFAAATARPSLRARLGGTDNLLAVVAAVLLPLGLLVIVLGWYGAAHTPYLFEQLPYLISGGLVGLALVLTGGLAYFATWIARGTSVQQRSSDEVVELLREIRDQLAERPEPRTPAPRGRTAAGANGKHALVATAGGSMLHRPDCAVVRGRDDVRAVSATGGLAPCGLCDPLAVTTV